MTSLQRKLAFGGIWLGFTAYAFLLAPPNDPKTLEQIIDLSTGQWGKLNPVIVALFNLMGVWPMIYAAVALADGHCQPEPDDGKVTAAWPFVAGSFGLGAFMLLPYLALRSPAPHWPATSSNGKGEPSRFLNILTSRIFGLFLLANALLWLGYALSQGDWSNFLEQWQSSRFIHVMSLDFCLLTLLFPVLAQDDARRHGIVSPQWAWLTSALPILGATLYLCFRPQFTKTEKSSV